MDGTATHSKFNNQPDGLLMHPHQQSVNQGPLPTTTPRVCPLLLPVLNPIFSFYFILYNALFSSINSFSKLHFNQLISLFPRVQIQKEQQKCYSQRPIHSSSALRILHYFLKLACSSTQTHRRTPHALRHSIQHCMVVLRLAMNARCNLQTQKK